MTWDRTERQEAILREKIAVIVIDRLNDPRLGFITITGVKLSKDKRHGAVSYTVLGTDSQRRTTERALNAAVPHIRELLAPTLGMRLMPELRFVYDESIERESQMHGLMARLAAERGEPPSDQAASDPPVDGDPPADSEDESNEDADDEADETELP